MTMSKKQQAAVRVQAQIRRAQEEAFANQPAMQRTISQLQQENESLRDTLAVVDRDLKDEQRARAGVQELLDALLSSDADAKHSPQAVAVRTAQVSMLKRMGWLSTLEVNKLRHELTETERALAVANRRIQMAETFGVAPSAVAVSADGRVAAVPIKPADLALAAGPADKKPAKKATK